MLCRRSYLFVVACAVGLVGCGDGGDGSFDLFGVDPSPTEDLPPRCNDVAAWDQAWVAFEDQVLALTNERRGLGANCGNEGTFPGAPALTFNAHLRCAARMQSKDLAVRAFFDHVNPDGEGPDDRITQAGYTWSTCGENIAAGQTTPLEVVDAWMNSPGHCSNIMHVEFKELGVGYFYMSGSYFHYWTQNFGRP
jgi:uncharacterized protein YkwD